MADDIILTAETGRPTGSSASRRLRATGKVPAVLYGRGAEPTPIAVDWRELRAALTTEKGLNALLTLKVGSKKTTAIVKEMQRHPVRRDVLHVDFLSVDVDVALTTDVPILLEGEALKVTREQGVVDHVLNALVIQAKQMQGRVVVIGGEGLQSDLDLIRAKQGLNITLSFDTPWHAWAVVDTVNSRLNGEEPKYPGVGVMLIDREHNLPPSGPVQHNINFRDVYRRAWGVG